MSDIELWKLLKEGDKNALEKIYLDHISLLIRYGRKFVANEQLVEDCVQDLFVELWKNREGLSETDSIKRYLMVAIRRKVIRQISKVQKTESSNPAEDYEFGAELAIEDHLIDLEISEEQSIKLKAAFENLSKRQKEAVYLKYYSGLDYEDICEVMDISYQSIRNLIFNALKSLRKHMLLFFMLLFS